MCVFKWSDKEFFPIKIASEKAKKSHFLHEALFWKLVFDIEQKTRRMVYEQQQNWTNGVTLNGPKRRFCLFCIRPKQKDEQYGACKGFDKTEIFNKNFIKNRQTKKEA